MNKNIKAALLTVLILIGVVSVVRLMWAFPDVTIYTFFAIAVISVVGGIFITIKQNI